MQESAKTDDEGMTFTHCVHIGGRALGVTLPDPCSYIYPINYPSLVGGFKYFLFSPLFGGMIHFD